MDSVYPDEPTAPFRDAEDNLRTVRILSLLKSLNDPLSSSIAASSSPLSFPVILPSSSLALSLSLSLSLFSLCLFLSRFAVQLRFRLLRRFASGGICLGVHYSVRVSCVYIGPRLNQVSAR